MSNWTDAIVSERMEVDREFSQQVRESRFSNQEWDLIMTATEFEIENADDPETARLVADTERVPQIIPALDEMSERTGAAPGMNAGGSGGGGSRGNGSGGIVSNIKDALFGGGGGSDSEKVEAAERLADEYAAELQQRLEANGKWEQVRIVYQE